MVKKDFREKTKFKNFFTGAHAQKGTVMITIEYSVKINENEKIIYLTNVSESLFEKTLFVLLKCGYLIDNITPMIQ